MPLDQWCDDGQPLACGPSRLGRSVQTGQHLRQRFQAAARSGRKASGRAAASCRRISTASWLAASASSRRPRLESRDVKRGAGRAGSVRRAASRRRSPPPPARRQRLLPPPQLGQTAEGCSAHGEVGEEGVGPGRRQLPADVDRLLRSPPAPPPAGPASERSPQVVQRRGQVGQEGVGPRRRQPPVDLDRLLDRGQRLLPPAQLGQADASRLFRPLRRSGRKASGRAAASSR